MAGRIIGCLCSCLCGIPFLFLHMLAKDSRDPVPFWTGDTSLKGIIGDVKAYNAAMGKLYKRYGLAFCASGIACALVPAVGFALVMLCATAGVYFVYRQYKRNVEEYRK